MGPENEKSHPLCRALTGSAGSSPAPGYVGLVVPSPREEVTCPGLARKSVAEQGITSCLAGSPRCELNNEAGVNLEAKGAGTLCRGVSSTHACSPEEPVAPLCDSGVSQLSVHPPGCSRESLSTRSVNI